MRFPRPWSGVEDRSQVRLVRVIKALSSLRTLAVRNQRMRRQIRCRAQEFMEHLMWLDSKPRTKGKSYHMEIQNKKPGPEHR